MDGVDGLPRNYDAWRTAGPEVPPVVGRCVACSEDVVEGEKGVETVNYDLVHAECLDEAVEREYVFRRF